MEYQISLNKYELNVLIDAIRTKIKQEQYYKDAFCSSGDMFAADLQDDTVTRMYTLLGKLTAIPQKGDK